MVKNKKYIPKSTKDASIKDKNPIEEVLVKIENKTLYRVKQTQTRWRDALQRAESKELASRTELYNLYRDLELDSKLSALIELKKDRIQAVDFILYNKDTKEVDEEAINLFNDKWFYDFISYFIDTIFWGHTLLQITEVADGEIKNLELVPRFNVKPETKEILVNFYDTSGESYDIPELEPYLIEIGGKDTLGLYKKLAPLVLWKKFALQFWSEFQEVFGTPIRIGKTKSVRAEDRARFENMLKSMGSSAYGIVGEQESVEFVESKRTDSYSVYLELINFINSEMSTLILGATDNTSGGANGSQARATVHEQQSSYKTMSDLRSITFYINKVLLPKLVMFGLVKDNIAFRFEDKESLSSLNKIEVDSKLVDVIESGLFDKDYITNRYNVVLNDNVNTNE